MATYNAPIPAGLAARPPIKAADPAFGGRCYRFRSVVNLATVNGGSAVTTSDAIRLATIPAGYIFDRCEMVSSVSLTTSAQAIGTSATHGSNGQYRASAAYGTTVDILSMTAPSAAKAGSALAADTDIYMTLATASLPTSGTVVVDLYFNKP